MTEPVIALPGGLILRQGRYEDRAQLPDFNARIHQEDEADGERIKVFILDCLDGKNPMFRPDDFTVVEDTRQDMIVSCACLLSQVWSYEGIPFPVGQPEFVGTDPAYRNRGLVRAQFDLLHRWSQERGQVLQGITGIPWYYRQFGYEMAVDLDGGRIGYEPQIPKLAEGSEDPYRFRLAGKADLGFIASCYEYGCQRSLLSCLRNEREWDYEVLGRSPQNVDRREFKIIERKQDGEPVGFIGHFPWLVNGMPFATLYELKPGISWLEVTPSIIRYLWDLGQAYARSQGKICEAFGMILGEEHPSYEAVPGRLPRKRESYAWYIRIPDLKSFLRLIAPVLENRLRNSICSGYSGELTLGFYRSGLRLLFERGRLAGIEDWQHDTSHQPMAAFPDLTFLQLLTGHRSLSELQFAFRDCRARHDTRPLVEALFPCRSSTIWPVV